MSFGGLSYTALAPGPYEAAATRDVAVTAYEGYFHVIRNQIQFVSSGKR